MSNTFSEINLNWKSGKTQEAIKDLEHAFELRRPRIQQKKIKLRKSGLRSFMNWLANNLTAPEKYDIRVTVPVVYKKFDQYLNAMRRQLNHN